MNRAPETAESVRQRHSNEDVQCEERAGNFVVTFFSRPRPFLAGAFPAAGAAFGLARGFGAAPVTDREKQMFEIYV